ncbi:GTP-binding protein [Salmonella enterica subsp. enterica serovar Livingstone]|uniref:GTP-binding protein n=1 Tax=Escherichia coli TaxID=562 RepID=A0A0P7LF02_ECOLX|nr:MULTISPECIES: LeoA/HP0731 family dynamin-like GTPase [Enterobacteriaceae]EAO9832680.1 GTP-binding protein [Salmonella enterica]EDV3995585.1 GTP-binding protein [Salmonella enterica subsp. enterica serovar Mbandaka]EED7479710.1 GTP-binding protein [Salmonella enterica subsp. enterica serovar Livingstone]EJS7334165.1 50S ribosome-binding GTPase [Salmonella enterica subsp. enterica serovar Lille]EKV9562992.1 50S ribosome-binding GTPase [Enterobacter hormaechei]
MEQFKQFSIEKQAAINSLLQLRGMLETLGEMEIDVNDDLQKIASAITAVESDVLRIALLGAFSDGKTSVIAAWLGKIMEDMNISMDESSDRLSIYKPEGLPGECEIVDTPGLFGDKEREIDGKQVMYEDLTKRFISEAHLLFYVVDATNPLKESHSAIAKWVLRDLNKLSSTIFIINKMDEVTDLTDQALFAEQAAIKKENLKGKLQRAANLNALELEQLNIVCIASNPNGRGLPFWFNKPEHYESRSRINDLKTVAAEILKTNVPEVLLAKTGMDVVKDIVTQRITSAQLHLSKLSTFVAKNDEDTSRFTCDIQQSRNEVKRLAGEMFEELSLLEKQLMSQLRPLELDGIRPFMDDELGYNDEGVGFKLHLRIKHIVDRFFAQSSAVTQRLSDDITRQLNSSESFLSGVGEGAFKSLGGVFKGISKISPETIKTTIFAARDTIGQLTGYVYTFKPWEATKLAGGIAKWAGPAGAAFTIGSDLWDAYKAHERERELEEAKNELTRMIKDPFSDIYSVLSSDEKTFAFFAPQIQEMEKVICDLTEKSDTIRKSQQKLSILQQKLEQFNRSSEQQVS